MAVYNILKKVLILNNGGEVKEHIRGQNDKVVFKPEKLHSLTLKRRATIIFSAQFPIVVALFQ